MSWIEAVQSPLVITTGDGKKFSPLWRATCVKDIEYNLSQFDFPKISGSQIYRGAPMARKFSLDICFQGDTHLDQALAFEISANDSRPWNISHPIYGSVLVQPTGLKFDYSGYNITQVTGTMLETLGSAGLKFTVVPIDKINADKAEMDETIAESFSTVSDINSSRELSAGDLIGTKQVTTLKGINKALYDLGVKQIKLTEDAGTYLNLFNDANSKINQVITAPGEAIRAIIAVVNFPALIVTSVKVRLSLLGAQLESLRSLIDNAPNPTNKKNYETLAGSLVSASAVASVTSYDAVGDLITSGILPDYKTKTDVLSVIDSIKELYDGYLDDLDSIQTDNGGLPDSYMPDAQSLISLNEIINFTLSNLSIIALDAKQQRTIILDHDTNVILLAHRLYGLEVDDSSIDVIIDNNKIYQNELLQVKKGRSIIYYI